MPPNKILTNYHMRPRHLSLVNHSEWFQCTPIKVKVIDLYLIDPFLPNRETLYALTLCLYHNHLIDPLV